MKRLLTVALPITGLLFLAAHVAAVTTTLWKEDSRAEFEQGKLTQVAVTGIGKLRLSNDVADLGPVTEPYVWRIATDSKGNLIVGTGDQGAIHRIAPDGRSALLYRSSEIHIHSIVVDKEDNVYAGTSPRGMIYKIAPKGEVTVFYDAPDQYIWSLVLSQDGKSILAGTGCKGRILKIAMNGAASVLFDAPQSHVLAMSVDAHGNVYSGTEPDGIVYKTSPDGRTTVLYDAEEDEIHCVAVDDAGCVYAGTADAGGPAFPAMGAFVPRMPPTGPAQAAPPTLDTTAQQAGSEPPPATGLPPRPGTMPPILGGTRIQPNCVYKISPDGQVTRYIEFKDSMVTSLALDRRYLYVGTGDKGRLFKVSLASNRDVEIIGANNHKEILAILPIEKGLVFGTGNPGAVKRFSNAFAQKGTFESQVWNAKNLAHWGRISWKAAAPFGTSVSLATRTGNSAKPDATWSPWSREYRDSSGEKIASPPGRYIQYRVTLSTGNSAITPEVASVTVACLPLNTRPEIAKLAIDGATDSDAAKPATTAGANPAATASADAKKSSDPPKHDSTRSITWTATDKDGDDLTCDLFFKGTDETTWKLLKKEITKPPFKHDWDTETVPDGEYRLKLVASDSPSNPPEKALVAEEISEPFTIDNTRPVIQDAQASVQKDGTCVVKGKAVDLLSNILSISYSVDAGDWVQIFPDDDIYDAPSEPFTITTAPLSKGEHTIVIKAVDVEGNVGSGKAVAKRD